MTKRPEPNRHVMLNLFQHLVCFFLLSAEAPFIPVHRTGFSGAILIKIVSSCIIRYVISTKVTEIKDGREKI
jgi:hypothetical protein